MPAVLSQSLRPGPEASHVQSGAGADGFTGEALIMDVISAVRQSCCMRLLTLVLVIIVGLMNAEVGRAAPEPIHRSLSYVTSPDAQRLLNEMHAAYARLGSLSESFQEYDAPTDDAEEYSGDPPRKVQPPHPHTWQLRHSVSLEYKKPNLLSIKVSGERDKSQDHQLPEDRLVSDGSHVFVVSQSSDYLYDTFAAPAQPRMLFELAAKKIPAVDLWAYRLLPLPGNEKPFDNLKPHYGKPMSIKVGHAAIRDGEVVDVIVARAWQPVLLGPPRIDRIILMPGRKDHLPRELLIDYAYTKFLLKISRVQANRVLRQSDFTFVPPVDPTPLPVQRELDSIARAYQSLNTISATVHEVSNSYETEYKTVDATSTILLKKPNLVSVVRVANGKTSRFVCDGSHLYGYDPDNFQAYHVMDAPATWDLFPSDAVTLFKSDDPFMFHRLRKWFRFSPTIEQGETDGVPVVILKALFFFPWLPPTTQRWSFGQTDHLLRSIEFKSTGTPAALLDPPPGGWLARDCASRETARPNSRRVTLSDVKVNIALDDGIFQFKPPTGAKAYSDSAWWRAH